MGNVVGNVAALARGIHRTKHYFSTFHRYEMPKAAISVSQLSLQMESIRPAADTFHDMTEAVTLREKPIAECGDETSGARNKPGAVAGRD